MFVSKRNSPKRRQTDNNARTQIKRPSVFSYRASRSTASDNLGRGKSRTSPDTPVQRPSMKKHRLKRLAIGAAFFVFFLVVGSNLLLDSSHPDIVVIGANSYRNSDAYYSAAVKAFGSSPLNSNKVTINVKKIEEKLRRDFPELADVSVSLPFIGRKPTIYLEPSSSRLIMHTSSAESFVLDENGRATASGEIVAKFKEAGLPEVQDLSQVPISLGDVAIPSTTVEFITEVVRQLKAKNVEITELTLLNTPNELHLRIKDEGYYIKFNTRGDARVAVGAFLSLKAYLEPQGKKPGEYIDVRIENRSYYK